MDGDFESLGINGQAVVDEEAGISGIWVAGVAPGSPASETGILPGDIVTTLNGLPVGSDGTYSDYCDVIRTAGDKPITVEVLRYDTSEVLRGELNGDKPLEQAFSFAEELGTRSPRIRARRRPSRRDQRLPDAHRRHGCAHRRRRRSSGPTSTPHRSRSTTGRRPR